MHRLKALGPEISSMYLVERFSAIHGQERLSKSGSVVERTVLNSEQLVGCGHFITRDPRCGLCRTQSLSTSSVAKI